MKWTLFEKKGRFLSELIEEHFNIDIFIYVELF